MKTIQSLIAEMYFDTHFDKTVIRFEASSEGIIFKWGSDYVSIAEEECNPSDYDYDRLAILGSSETYSLMDGLRMLGGNEVRDLFRRLPSVIERGLPGLVLINSVFNDDFDEFTLLGSDVSCDWHKLILRLPTTLNTKNAIKAADFKDALYEQMKEDSGVDTHDVLSGIFIDFINGLDRSVFKDPTNVKVTKSTGSITYTCTSVYGDTSLKVLLGTWSSGIGLSSKALERLILPDYLFSLCQSLETLCVFGDRGNVIFRVEEQDEQNKYLKIILRGIGTVEITIP